MLQSFAMSSCPYVKYLMFKTIDLILFYLFNLDFKNLVEGNFYGNENFFRSFAEHELITYPLPCAFFPKVMSFREADVRWQFMSLYPTTTTFHFMPQDQSQVVVWFPLFGFLCFPSPSINDVSCWQTLMRITQKGTEVMLEN